MTNYYLVEPSKIETLSNAFETGRPGLVRKTIRDILAQPFVNPLVQAQAAVAPIPKSSFEQPSRGVHELSRALLSLINDADSRAVITLQGDPAPDASTPPAACHTTISALWTGGKPKTFSGDTIEDCLEAAESAREAIRRAEEAMQPTPPDRISEILYPKN